MRSSCVNLTGFSGMGWRELRANFARVTRPEGSSGALRRLALPAVLARTIGFGLRALHGRIWNRRPRGCEAASGGSGLAPTRFFKHPLGESRNICVVLARCFQGRHEVQQRPGNL